MKFKFTLHYVMFLCIPLKISQVLPMKYSEMLLVTHYRLYDFFNLSFSL